MTARHASRTGAVAALFALLFWLVPSMVTSPALAQVPDASPTSSTVERTTVERTTAVRDRGSNVAGAVAGFGLLAGWLTLGYVQFRRARRRLAAADTDDRLTREDARPHSAPDDDAAETQRSEPDDGAQRASRSPAEQGETPGLGAEA